MRGFTQFGFSLLHHKNHANFFTLEVHMQINAVHLQLQEHIERNVIIIYFIHVKYKLTIINIFVV